MKRDQLSLFNGLMPPDTVRPPNPSKELLELSSSLPKGIRFGTSSWSFPGWQSKIYQGHHESSLLAREGLKAYSQHPLLRAVGIDRTWYNPISTKSFAEYAAQVPKDFRFLVKAHQLCTHLKAPTQKPGEQELNPLFLQPEHALKHVVEPYAEGLQQKGGVLLFQFAPQTFTSIGGPAAFADKLGEFFHHLPKDLRYAVEVRNRELITADYATILREQGVGHTAVVYPRMPSIDTQARVIGATSPQFIIARWMLRPNLNYKSAIDRYQPFRELVEPDIERRAALTRLLKQALTHQIPALIIVNNKAEGCAPDSIHALASSLSQQLS